MTDEEQRSLPRPLHLEIPMEPLPTEPLVPRPAVADPPLPPPEDTAAVTTFAIEEAGHPNDRYAAGDFIDTHGTEDPDDTYATDDSDDTYGIDDEATIEAAPLEGEVTMETPAVEDVFPERGGAGHDVLRPTTPRPALAPRSASDRPPRFTDSRHPFRAAFGLIFLVILGSLALAGAIGIAIAVVAFAVRSTVS